MRQMCVHPIYEKWNQTKEFPAARNLFRPVFKQIPLVLPHPWPNAQTQSIVGQKATQNVMEIVEFALLIKSIRNE